MLSSTKFDSWTRLAGYVKRNWFLVVLASVISVGFGAGAIGVTSPERFPLFVRSGDWWSRYVVVATLYLMSVTLDTAKIAAALRAPGPVVWASIVNMLVIPLAAWGCLGFQLSPDLATGLAVAASVPCTMAAASVWTRKAGGNDAVSLLVTVVTNCLAFIVAPFWLGQLLGSRVTINTPKLIDSLIWVALVPIVIGQLTRISQLLRSSADRHKSLLSNTAQVLILLTVLWSAYKAGPYVASSSPAMETGTAVTRPTLLAILVVWISAAGLHVLGLWIGLLGGRALRFSAADTIAAAIAGSQKTLPVGMLMASEVARQTGQPFVVFPMLMFHASQLVIDTIVVDRVKIAVPPKSNHVE